MIYSKVKRLFLAGVFFSLLFVASAQNASPWQFINVGSSTTGFGLAMDSSYIYTGASLQSGTFASYLFKINQATGESDSVLISESATESFLPFYVHLEDSLVVYFGGIYDWTKSGNDPTSRRCAIVRLRKDLSFKDSLVFNSPGTYIWQVLKLGTDYFITEGGVNTNNKFTRISSLDLKIDTSITLPPLSHASYELSLAFSDSLNKMLVMSSPGRVFVIDTGTFNIDSTFISWNTSFPYGPDVVDFFSWDGDLTSISDPWGVRLYHYDQSGMVSIDFPVFSMDTLAGAESYVRGCYGFSDSLLVFSTSGPYTAAPPTQTNTVTHIRLFAVNKKGEIQWQTKIQNGRNNLVHSQATDNNTTFVYVRSIDGTDQEMQIYKVDDNGNLLQLDERLGYQKIGVHLYPNPAQGTVHFDASGMFGEVEEITFELYNVHGQRCFQKVISPIKGTFDLHRFSPGTYYYKFSINQDNLRSGLLILQ